MDRAQTQSGHVHGAQFAVEHLVEIFRRPSLTGLEILWRWIAGVPVLALGWLACRHILAVHPLSDSGFNALDTANPWVAIVQLSDVWTYYAPHVFTALYWLVPAGAALWVVASGLGRNALLRRMEPGLPWLPLKMVGLQAAWLLLLALTLTGWFREMRWAVSTHISLAGEIDLAGLAKSSIWITLGFLALFALVSWIYSVAPILLLLDRPRSALSALALACRLGWRFTGRLIEINVVMGIVKLALIVLALVCSAAPLPFSDAVDATAVYLAAAAAMLVFLVADDYFQVVRLKAMVDFWKVYRGRRAGEPAQLAS